MTASGGPTTPATAPAPPRGRGLEWREARVTHVERPSDANVVLRLETPADRPLPFVAGQFVYLRHPGPSGEPVKAAYSIASPPYEKRFIELCVKKVEGGASSTWMYEREVGDTLTVSRAFGGFRFATPAGRTAVMLATGTGIAPLRAMLLDELRKGWTSELGLYYGVGRVVNLVYGDELRRLAATHKNFRFTPVVSRAGVREWDGERGWVQEPFIRDFQGRRDFDAYICGVKVMVDDVARLVASMGIPPAQIHLEKYT